MTVELPVKCPTSCTFGGADLATLYITTRGPDGGGLYAVDLPEGVRGQVEPEYRSSYTSRVRKVHLPNKVVFVGCDDEL
jgi:hypothetical protein